jgi:hypothetical protein
MSWEGFGSFHLCSQKFDFGQQAEPEIDTRKRETTRVEKTRLTIQCESFGNPDTTAGPKARAVFMAAPV